MSVEWPRQTVLDRIADRKRIMGFRSERAFLQSCGLHVDLLRDLRTDAKSRKRIPPPALKIIADALQTTPAYLMGETEGEPGEVLEPAGIDIPEIRLTRVGASPEEDAYVSTGSKWHVPAHVVARHIGAGRLVALHHRGSTLFVDVVDRARIDVGGLFYGFIPGEGFGVLAGGATPMSSETMQPIERHAVFGRIVLTSRPC